jgi:2-oxoglutarate ferredoxin oxidoreductase subunit beta
MATLADFRTSEKSWWCPGCGDFGVLAALQKALVNLGLDPKDVAVVAGIGCSGKIGNYVNSYNLHVTHGRTMPAALGLKLANRNLTVIAAGGDGDGFAIGMGHFIHAVRRNPNITYIIMDNNIYGLTKGQTSPTSDTGFKTKTTPEGSVEHPVDQLQLALAAGATFVAQGFSSNQAQLVKLIEEGIKHPGFAMINTISPCVTVNKVNTYDYYRAELQDLEKDPNYNPEDRAMAMNKLLETEGMVTGLIYRNPNSVPYEDKIPGAAKTAIVDMDWRVEKAAFDKLLANFK